MCEISGQAYRGLVLHHQHHPLSEPLLFLPYPAVQPLMGLVTAEKQHVALLNIKE